MPLLPRLDDDHPGSADPVAVWVGRTDVDRRVARSASAALLRDVLARRLGVDRSTLSFETTCQWCGDERHGKPRVGAPPATGVRFSVSRSRGVVVVAVADVEVGVDVEHAEVDGVDQLVPFVLSPHERTELSEAGPRAFLRLWTAKEAYLKGIGLGLGADPTAVSFSDEAKGWRAVHDQHRSTKWHVTELDVGEDWVAALAVAGDPLAVVVRPWTISR
jgi:4'-phosphopantetheinyl transferase